MTTPRTSAWICPAAPPLDCGYHERMTEHRFHPLVQEWFESRFGAPTDPQRAGWPQIAAGNHTLIAAPTGSGKTLAAFLVCIDRL